MKNKDKYHPFSKEEYQHLIIQAVKGSGGQTTEELQSVINEAIGMRVSSMYLNEVMEGNVVMYCDKKSGKVVYKENLSK